MPPGMYVPERVGSLATGPTGARGSGRFFLPGFPDVQESEKSPDMHYRYVEMAIRDSYVITMTLHDSSKRYMLGIAVDGRHVMSGKAVGNAVGALSTWEEASAQNYVVDGVSNTIRGWRESESSVRAFVVTQAAQSLATRWGDPTAMGTIVVAIFDEKVPDLAVVTKGSGARTRDIGTGAGQSITSVVVGTTFLPKPIASEVFFMKYAPPDELRKLGVWVPEQTVSQSTPNNRLWPAGNKSGYVQFPKPR